MGAHELVTKFNPQKYVKLIVSVAGAVASALAAVTVTGGHLRSIDFVNLAIVAVGAVQVWYVTETSDNPHGKTVIAAITAGLVTVSSLLGAGGGIHPAEWAQVLVSVLTATGMLALPSTSVARKALPASYAQNTLVINAGTPYASTVEPARRDN